MFRARGRRGKRNIAVLKKDARRNFTLKRPWRFVWLVIAKFVVSRCAFCKLRGNFGFFCSVNHLNGPIRKHMFTCTSSKGHGFDSWLVDFDPFCLFRGSLLCDRPVSGNNRRVKVASQTFLIFLILVTCKNKATSASFLRQKIHSPSRFPSLFLSSLESFSIKLGEHVSLWFVLTPLSLKWLTERKNPSLQYAQRDTTNFAVKL